MAIVFTYPSINKNDVQPSDRLLLSRMTVNGNPTRSLTINNLREYLGAIIPPTVVIGTGTTNKVTKWINGAARQIGNSSINDNGSEVIVEVDFRVDGNNTDIESSKLNMVQGGIDLLDSVNTAKGITFTHPAGGASANVNLYFNGAGAGSRFVISRGATGGPEIELESSGNVNINRTGNGNFFVGGEVTLDDYGSGTITGIPTFNLEVDANGKIIETASGGGGGGIGGTGTIDTLPVFTAATTLGDSLVVSTSGGNGIGINMAAGGGSTATFRVESTGAGGTPDVMQLSSASASCNIMLDQSGGTPFGYYGNDCVAGGAATEMQLRSNTDLLFSSGGSTEHMRLKSAGDLQLPLYGSGTFSGTATYDLSVDASGNIIETATGGGSGYTSVQKFVWLSGFPVAYTNWINATASNLPFNATPTIEVGSYSGTAAAFAWSCANAAGGTAGQEATFTLGVSGAGTWKVNTCQNWFDQTNQVEVDVLYKINGITDFDVVKEKSTELTADKIFYGSLIKTFSAGDTLEVNVTFTGGGITPFPSVGNNRPIEITFERLV